MLSPSVGVNEISSVSASLCFFFSFFFEAFESLILKSTGPGPATAAVAAFTLGLAARIPGLLTWRLRAGGWIPHRHAGAGLPKHAAVRGAPGHGALHRALGAAGAVLGDRYTVDHARSRDTVRAARALGASGADRTLPRIL